MAKDTVEFLHYFTDSSEIIGGAYTDSVLLTKDDTEESKSKNGFFNEEIISSKSLVLNSILLEYSITIDDGSARLNITVGDESCELDVNKKSFEFPQTMIKYMNEYKAEHGTFPNIAFVYDIFTHRPTAGTTSVTSILLYPMIINCTINGGLLTLRPCNDIYREHNIPEGFDGAWSLINDLESDNEETCIGDRVESPLDFTGTLSSSLTTIVGFENPQKEIKVIQMTIKSSEQLNAFGNTDVEAVANIKTKLTAAGENYGTMRTSDLNSGIWSLKINKLNKDDSIVVAINDYVNKNKTFPEITYSINTDLTVVDKNTSKGGTALANLSQACIDILYEDILDIGIHRKVGGVVKAATAAYRKVGGSWAEIPEEEAKDILNNNIITQGGS
jgi:hypothetical protein